MNFLNKKKHSILLNILKYSFILVFVFMLVVPFFSVNACGGAGEPPCVDVGDTGSNDKTDTGSNNGTNGTNIPGFLENPLDSEIDDIPKFIEAIIQIVLTVGVPIVVLAVIYTGFLFVKAQGNSEEITKAKKALMYTLIGAALLLGAFVLANAIGDTVREIGG